MLGDQSFHEQSPEQAREDPHGQEEARPARNPPPTIWSDPATRHDHVDVRMMGHGRPLGMQHGDDTDLGAEMLGIGGNGEHGLGAGLEQQAVNHPLVGFLRRGGSGAGNGCGILDRRRTGHLGDFVGKFNLAVVLGPVADLAAGIGDAPQAVAVPADPVNNQKRLRWAK